MGAPYRWMVATRPGKLGGRSGCNKRAKQNQHVENGGDIGVRFGRGKREIQKRLKQVGQEEYIIVVNTAT